MSLMSKLSQFARSKQGKQLADQAVRAAKDPATRRKVDEMRRKLMSGRGGKRAA